MQLLLSKPFKILCKRLLHSGSLSATRCAASFTNQTAFLINKCFITAVRTFLAFGFRAISYVLLQSTFHTVLPGIDAFTIQLQRADKFHHLFNWHTIAEHTRYQFGIVPILFIKLCILVCSQTGSRNVSLRFHRHSL